MSTQPKPSELINQKFIDTQRTLLAHARAKNSALTHEQVAVIDVAATQEAIIWYLDELHAQAMRSKR